MEPSIEVKSEEELKAIKMRYLSQISLKSYNKNIESRKATMRKYAKQTQECSCGVLYTFANKSRHIKTKFHKEHITE